MLYNEITFTITSYQTCGYPVSVTAPGVGRVSSMLPMPDPALLRLLARVTAGQESGLTRDDLVEAGTGLYRWLMPDPLGAQLRLAWNQASRSERGLRLLLSVDPPEIAALPWELLYDPEQKHFFATAAATPLVRFLDQTNVFGQMAQGSTSLPLQMLLVLPAAPDLNLDQERAAIEAVAAGLAEVLRVDVLQGIVTRNILADALHRRPYNIVHLTGHGAFVPGPAALRGNTGPVPVTGQGYVLLNQPDGTADWVDEVSLSRLFANQPGLKLVVLNACSSGRLAGGAAFRDLAPVLVKGGAAAVAAMQYALSDKAAVTFAREFYEHLCTGEDAGHVDVAIAHARNALAALHPDEYAFAAPVLFTHAADGVVYRVPGSTPVQTVEMPKGESVKLHSFMSSLEGSRRHGDDWAMAGGEMVTIWRDLLAEAERHYGAHLREANEASREAAHQGLALVRKHMAGLDAVME